MRKRDIFENKSHFYPIIISTPEERSEILSDFSIWNFADSGQFRNQTSPTATLALKFYWLNACIRNLLPPTPITQPKHKVSIGWFFLAYVSLILFFTRFTIRLAGFAKSSS